MFWVLGIEPTTDKKKITAAYRERLVMTNPEEKPEQFKQLREAYEKALAYAENGGHEVKTPVEIWKDKLTALYADFRKRISIDAWAELIEDKICRALDTRMEIEDVLLHFFMEHYFIPHNVWLYLDSQFHFLDRVSELCENYPPDFVDYVLVNGATYDDVIPFDLFEPGLDGKACEAYCSLFLKMVKEMPENRAPIFESMRELPESHPYGIAYELAYDIWKGEDKLDELEALTEKYDYTPRIAYLLSEVYFNAGDYEKTESIIRKGLEAKSDDANLMWHLADALAAQEKYSDAIEMLHKLTDHLAGDPAQRHNLQEKRVEWNNKLIEKYSRELVERPDDDQLRLDYAWALLQNERAEEADDIARLLKEEAVKPFDYYNLMSYIDFFNGRVAESINKTEKLLDIVRHLEDDGTEKVRKQIKREGEILARKGRYLCAGGQIEEGEKAYAEALAFNPEDVDILSELIEVAYVQKKYDKAVAYAENLLRVKPNAYHAYYVMARCFFAERNDRDAFEAINKAIEYYGSELNYYILKIRILIRNGAAEGAKEILDFLEENGCADVLEVVFLKGLYQEAFEEEKDVLPIYESVISRIEGGEGSELTDEIYYHDLLLVGQKRNANKPEDRDEMLALCDKGLEFNPEHVYLRDYKAWLLMRTDDRKEEALAIYLELSKLEPHSAEVDYQIGAYYYSGKDSDLDKAVEYLEKAYAKGYQGCLYKLAYAAWVMNDIDKCEKYCLLLREEAVQNNYIDIDSYFRMSYVYEKRRQFDLAIKDNDIALEHARQRQIDTEIYHDHKIRLFRMAGKPYEAVNALLAKAKELGTGVDYALQTAIYLQFGLYDKALGVINLRLKDKNDKGNAAADLVRLYVLSGHIDDAKKTLKKYKRTLSEDAYKDMQEILDLYDLQYGKALVHRHEVLDKANTSFTKASALIRLAECYDAAGDSERATRYAEEYLEKRSELMPKYSTVHAIWDLMDARAYIVLNRFDEAQAIMDSAADFVCGHCTYGTCKDIDIFTLEMLLKQDRVEDAFSLCLEALAKWRDDEDFVILMERIKRRR